MQKAVAREIIHGEGGGEALIVFHAQGLEIDGEFVIFDFLGAAGDFRYLIVGEADGQQAVLQAVLAKMSAKEEAMITRKP